MPWRWLAKYQPGSSAPAYELWVAASATSSSRLAQNAERGDRRARGAARDRTRGAGRQRRREERPSPVRSAREPVRHRELDAVRLEGQERNRRVDGQRIPGTARDAAQRIGEQRVVGQQRELV